AWSRPVKRRRACPQLVLLVPAISHSLPTLAPGARRPLLRHTAEPSEPLTLFNSCSGGRLGRHSLTPIIRASCWSIRLGAPCSRYSVVHTCPVCASTA